MNLPSRSTFLRSAALGCAAAAAPRIASAQLVPLRVGSLLADVYGEPYYAKAAGTFAKAGFDLGVGSVFNGQAGLAALSGGSYDLTLSDIITGTLGVAAKLPILLVAASALYDASNPTTILAVAKNSTLRGPRDLRGKIIGLGGLSGLGYTCLQAWLAKNGIAWDEVKVIEIPTPSMGPALARGTVDVSLIGEPFLSYFKDDVRDFAHFIDVCGKSFVQTAWYASTSWFEADRDRARRVIGAIYDSARWANAHRDDTLAILVRDGKLDADKVQGMRRVPFATSLTPAAVQPVLNLGAQYKIFDQLYDAKQLITTV